MLVFSFENLITTDAFAQVLRPPKKEITPIGFWNVNKNKSIYDSLKAGNPLRVSTVSKIKNSPANKLKIQLTTLENREILEAAGFQQSAYPVSAGIFLNTKPTIISLSGLEKALKIFKTNGDLKAEALIMDYYGTYFGIQRNMEKSIKYFNTAYHLNDSLKDKFGMAKVSYKLAQVYQYTRNFDQATIHTAQVIKLSEGTVNIKLLASAYLLMGELATSQNKYSVAENYILKKALPAFYYKLKDKTGSMNCYRQLAKMYQQQKRMSEAKWFFIQENTLARNINHPRAIITSLINLAQVKTAIGDYKLAIRDYNEADKISIKNNFISKRLEIKNGLKAVHQKMSKQMAASKVLVVDSKSKQDLISKTKVNSLQLAQ